MLNRRQFLATAGLLSTAGCSAMNDSPKTPRPGPGDYHTYDEPMVRERGNTTVPESDHKAFHFESDQRMKLDYSAYIQGDDKTMDILVLKRGEYEEYVDGPTFAHNPGETVFGVDGAEKEGFLDSGRHTIVFDNTDEGTDGMDESITVRYNIRVMTY